jgi:hypothetical protein
MGLKTKQVLAAVAAVLSIAIVIWCIVDLIIGYSREKPSILVTLAVFYAAVAGWAIHWLVRKDREIRLGPAEKGEILLRLMTARGGRITIDEAAAESGFPPGTVREVLQRLCREGVCELRATMAGETVYVSRTPAAEAR